MLDLQDRLDELKGLGLYRRMRMVSGPQGPRVVLDGTPVLLLCSNNYLGLADHPRVREAAADAAMRWGAGTGASRLVSGNMTLHRRLEEVAAFKGTQSAVLFGSGYLANLGVIPALARRGEIVFADELNHPSTADGCRLAGAEVFAYRHGDVEHLAWGLRNADGRSALIATDGVFSMDGDVAPLAEIVDLARRHDVRVMVDDAHGDGTLGRGGRRERRRGRPRRRGRRHRRHARQGLRVLRRVRRVRRPDGALSRQQRADADVLDRAPARRGRGGDGGARAAGGAAATRRAAGRQRRRASRRARARGLRRLRAGDADRAADRRQRRARPADLRGGAGAGRFAQAIRPPGARGTSRLRLAVMASHTKEELRDAARILARAALRNGLRPSATVPVAATQSGPRPAAARGVFDADADSRLARAA